MYANQFYKLEQVSTHSRPKAAVVNKSGDTATEIVSTHSRPKAAVHQSMLKGYKHGFNTQPPEGGCAERAPRKLRQEWFQHTAARRRLRDCFEEIL